VKRKNAYTIIYAILLGLACAAIPTGWKIYTQPRYDANKKLDEYRNVLEVLGRYDAPTKALSSQELVTFFESNVEKQVVNAGTGDALTLYYMKTGTDAVAINFIGAGLWGKIYGYIALDPIELRTIKAFTVYRHEETPGLGGEIEKAWFKDLFKGKTFITADGAVFKVARPGAGTTKENEIDGISGATLTGNKLNYIFKVLKDRVVKINKEDLHVGK
jgi:Na+-transporting NADH:ubiquinone oxidoreductase subunit C